MEKSPLDQNNQTQDNHLQDENVLEENQQKISGIWQSIKAFLYELLNIRSECDHAATVEAVRKDISFKGPNAWILVFSIMVASIGLNVSSIPVVIGAMLISPLMGPIVGIGMGMAINDSRMLKRSFVNIGVMVGLSVLTATLYFLLSPLAEYTEELRARTYPTILDVFVAIFGGLALIVAKAKKGTIAPVIFGVAIATALMPPLCTAGYGFSVWEPKIFGGALYLFTINSIFIGLSAFTVTKFLRFPLVKYANQKKRKRTMRIAWVVGILALIPSIILFVFLLQEQYFKNQVDEFIDRRVHHDGTAISVVEQDYDGKRVDVYLVGKRVPDNLTKLWERDFKQEKRLAEASIIFHQGAEAERRDESEIEKDYIVRLRQIASKEERIAMLEAELDRVKKSLNDFERLSKEAKLNYPQLGKISYAPSIKIDFETDRVDTLDVFNVSWADSTLSIEMETRLERQLSDWLEFRLLEDTVVVNKMYGERSTQELPKADE